ncbi:MAG: GNAT family N-acetyltransferase [Flavobacteriales bacterium]|nr:GNAT family N-acetyltransferase [Flavobacteriales bacterium]MDP4665779.1 GNAT family N-acetyltransferase [Flavobacteriaceae bacterium]MDP4954129.1 GNAT family N-acetyltransferase [Flavobacteriales bacterium]
MQLQSPKNSQRLSYRAVNPSDFEDWLPLFEKAEVPVFIGLDASLSKRELCKNWFEKVFDRYENERGGMNALVDLESGVLVGQCGLLIQDIEGEQMIEVGYSILPKFWGQGYASEAAQAHRNHAFENNLANALVSVVHVDNIKSAKVARNNGMRIVKTFTYRGEMPVNLFRITKAEYDALKVL